MPGWTPDLLAGVLDSFPLGVALLGPDGRVFYTNRELSRITGRETFELMDDGFYDLTFPNPAVNARLRSKALAAGEAPFDDLDLSATVADGEKRHFHFCGAALTGESDSCLILSVQDVTHRKAFEKVIESSFDKFIQVTNALDAALKKIGEQNAILEGYKEKMTRELAIAKGVQKAINPREFPTVAGFDLYGVAIPTDELGGDYFDWFQVDGERLGLLIADVSGHGVPSSLITTMVKSSFEFHTRRHPDPATVLTLVNRDVTAIIADTGFFLTVFYGVLHLPTREFRVSLAGHDAAFCLSAGEVTRLGVEGEGTILGVFPEATYSSSAYSLPVGARVLVCTDGIPEARSSSGEFYGVHRIEALVRRLAGASARQTVEALVAETDAFYAGAAPNDDRTLWAFDLTEVLTPAQAQVRAKRAFADRQFEACLGYLTPILSAGDRGSEPCCLAGQALAHLGRSAEACDHFEEAVRADSRAIKAWYYLGLVRHNLGDSAGARHAWVRVRELDPHYKDIQTLLATPGR